MIRKVIIAIALVASIALGQDVNVTIAADGPPAVNNATGSVVGQRQGIVYYYWVIARYPSGDAQGFGPITVYNGPGTLGGSNSIILTWNAQSGATSYAVLRNINGQNPLSNNACAACLVGTTTSTTLTDSGGALGAFTRTPNPGRTVTTLSLDTKNYPNPALRLGDYFPWQPVGTGSLADRPSSCTGLKDAYICTASDCAANPSVYYCTSNNSWSLISGGGGTPGGVDRSVQFNNAGTLDGSANFTFDSSGVLNNLNGFAAGDGIVTGEFTLLEGAVPAAPVDPNKWKFFVDTTGDWFTMRPTAGTTYYLSRSAAKLDCSAANTFVTTDANGVQSCAAAAAGGITTVIESGYNAGSATTSATTIYSATIPANTFQVGDFLEVEALFTKTGTNGTMRTAVNWVNNSLEIGSCGVSTAVATYGLQSHQGRAVIDGVTSQKTVARSYQGPTTETVCLGSGTLNGDITTAISMPFRVVSITAGDEIFLTYYIIKRIRP